MTRPLRPGSVRVRWVGAFVIFGSLGFMLGNLPRLLGSSHGVRLMLDTVAFLPVAAPVVVAVRLAVDYAAVRAAVAAAHDAGRLTVFPAFPTP